MRGLWMLLFLGWPCLTVADIVPQQCWSGFNHPNGIAVSRGHVYVTDENRIRVFNQNGGLIAAWDLSVNGAGEFRKSIGIAATPDGHLVVVYPDLATIKVFDQNGDVVCAWGSFGSRPGQFDNPYFAAVDRDGNVYIGDNGNRRIQVFTPTGDFLRLWSLDDTPTGLAVNRDGHLVVGTVGGRILTFSTYGCLLSNWGTAGTGNGQFRTPFGVGIDRDDNVYVADRFNHRVQVFSPDGAYITQWGSLGTANGQFQQPFGVAVGENDWIYVTDRINDRVQVFQPRQPRGRTAHVTDNRHFTWGELKTRYR